jgi:hypothetical protein
VGQCPRIATTTRHIRARGLSVEGRSEAGHRSSLKGSQPRGGCLMLGGTSCQLRRIPRNNTKKQHMCQIYLFLTTNRSTVALFHIECDIVV